MLKIIILSSLTNLVIIGRLHNILEYSPFGYGPINNYINSQTSSKSHKAYTNMSVIENNNFGAKPGHQGTPDAPPRATLSGGACTTRTPIPTISDGHQILQATPTQHDKQLS